MKSLSSSIRKKLIEKYTASDNSVNSHKRTDINVLLNRVKSDQKKRSEKKILFFCSCINRTNFIWFDCFFLSILKFSKKIVLTLVLLILLRE